MGVDKANPKPEFPVPPEPTTGSLIVPRPSPEGAISKALCPDCAFPCGQALGRGLRALAQPPCGLAGGCPSAFAQLSHSPIGMTAAGSESVPASTATRPRTYRTHCHSALIVPTRHARRRLAVRAALPLAPERAAPYARRRVAVHGVPSGADHQRVPHAPKRPDGVLPHAGLSPEELQELPPAVQAQLPRAPCPIGVDITEKSTDCQGL